MTDSIKFGPEWLRNMSQGISKPQLAEHRYGREEMLALFDISSCNVPPESLKELSMAYSDKPQTPLSLQQMSEEETRLWNRGINSDTIVRASVRTTGARSTAVNIEVRGASTSARGRGGRGGYYYNTTRPGYEEGPEGGGSPMNRGPHRPFERLNSNERNMSRNGEYTNDWRGRDESNWWRKNRGGSHQGQSEESNSRWGRTRSDSYNNDRWPAGRPTSRYEEDEGWDNRGESRWSNNSSTNERRRLDWGDNLPEWAVDNPGEKGGSFDSSGAFHDNHYEEDRHYSMGDEQSEEKEQEYEEEIHNDTSVNNLESSTVSPTKDKQLNGSQEKDEIVSSSISTSPSQNEEVMTSPDRFKSMRQQHQNNINTQTQDTFIHNEQVIVNHPEPIRIHQVLDNNPVSHSKSSPAIPLMSDCQPNNMENIREISGMPNHVDNANINSIHRSTSLNANANHRIDTLDAEAESMVSRLTSDNFKIGPSSHTPLTPIINNKWFYRDPQGEVQGPFTTTEMAEWYSLGYFHDNMLMVKRECDEHFYSLGDLVRLKGNVPFTDIPFSERDVKITTRVQPPPTHNHFTMNESLVLQQQQQQYQYRQLLLNQRELAIQSAVHQLSQSERWNTLSPIEQQQMIMHQIRNVEANTTIPPIFTAPILPQPQPTMHPMNQPSNNLMVMLSHMQQQQQQQQHFNHQIDPKHNIHVVPPSQPMPQQLDPLHSLVHSMGGLKTATPPPMNTPHHHQNSNVIRPNSAQSESNPISDLLRQLGAPQDKPLKVAETSVWGVDFAGPDSKPKMNGPIGIAGWQTGSSGDTTQQTPNVIWGSGEYTKIIGADHQAIEEAIKEEARRSDEARKQEIIKQKEQIRKREEEKSKMQKELKRKQELEKAKLEEEKKKEEVRRNKEHEKKLKEEAEKKKLEKKKLEEEQAKKRVLEKKLKEEKEKRLQEEKRKEEEKRHLEEEKKRKAELKKKEEQKKKDEQKKKEEIKRKEDAKKQDQKKKDEDQKKKQENLKPSSVPIVTEPLKKKKKDPHNGLESGSAPWAATDQKKHVQVKSMAEIQAEEQKHEQMMKQKERERTEREISIVALEQAKQEKARSAVKMQSWSNVIAKNVPQPNLMGISSIWGSSNQLNTDKPKLTKTPAAVTINNNKSAVKNIVKSVNQTAQQTKAMKKVIESRGENNNCNDEFSQWCCKHLATLNKNTIDIPTFVTFLKDVESEFEVKDYIQNYLGDNKEVREFIKQFIDKRLKIQNKQKSSDFVEMKSKNKKRNKMVPLDNKVLGFNVVASERINVGELDLGE